MNSRTTLTYLIASLSLWGCSHHVYSPPARGPTLRAVRTLPAGTTAVQASAHYQGGIFGPSVAGASVAVRKALHPEFEIAVDGTFMHVMDKAAADLHRGIYAGRVEGRFNPRRNRIFALFSGVGGGYSPDGGGFFSVDIGLTVAFENCYATPFASIAGLVSTPIDPRQIDTRTALEEEPQISRAKTTYGVQISLGLRVPLGGYASCPRKLAPLALTVAMGGTSLDDGSEQDGFIGFSGGLEMRF